MEEDKKVLFDLINKYGLKGVVSILSDMSKEQSKNVNDQIEKILFEKDSSVLLKTIFYLNH